MFDSFSINQYNENNDNRNVLIIKSIIFILILSNLYLSNYFDENIRYSFNSNKILNVKEECNDDLFINKKSENFSKEQNIQLNNTYSFRAIYRVIKQKETIIFINNIYNKYIDELIIDDKKINSSNNHTFNNEGEHEIFMSLTNNFNITDYMFSGISSLLSIYFTKNFNFNKIKSAKGMFKDCKNLKNVSFNDNMNKNLIDISLMFTNCYSLKYIDISGFVTSKTKNISYLFTNCTSLKSIDLSSFDTINVNNMEGLFYGCSSLTSLDLIPFETVSTISMKYMFAKCISLTSINLYFFETDRIEDISYMFEDCSKLKYVKMPIFNKTKNINSIGLFFGCTSLLKKE